MNKSLLDWTAPAMLAVLTAAMTAGCETNIGGLSIGPKGSPSESPQKVPSPIDLTLPHQIRIHPFTGTRTFDEAGGISGIDLRIEAKDAFGDSTKAFGDFRFELYTHRTVGPDVKGKRIGCWTESALEPKKNLVHWDNIAKHYQFKLQWEEPITVGKRFVIVATFSSPFTDRLFDERVFVSGQ